RRIDVDFDAGTLSVNGGAPTALGGSIASFTAALNTALGGNGTAGFSNGVLSLAATGGDGLVIKDDAAAPTSRGGTAFSQFFGLNDIFKAQTPSISGTGLSAASASGLA